MDKLGIWFEVEGNKELAEIEAAARYCDGQSVETFCRGAVWRRIAELVEKNGGPLVNDSEVELLNEIANLKMQIAHLKGAEKAKPVVRNLRIDESLEKEVLTYFDRYKSATRRQVNKALNANDREGYDKNHSMLEHLTRQGYLAAATFKNNGASRMRWIWTITDKGAKRARSLRGNAHNEGGADDTQPTA